MDCKIVYLAPRLREHGAIPTHVVVADGDEFYRRVYGAHRACVGAKVARVRGRVRVAANPVAPYFVPDLPELDAEGLWVSVRRAHRPVLRRGGAVAVLDPRGGLLDEVR